MRRDPRTYLWDALHAADLVAKFTHNKTFPTTRATTYYVLLRSGVERQLEIVGEALNQLAKVDAELAGRVPELGDIVGFRNILAHGYAVVDDALCSAQRSTSCRRSGQSCAHSWKTRTADSVQPPTTR
ncbi:MAG: HepT-like ribonuclease domain-containing protein [Egibacteraceae bacterium]